VRKRVTTARAPPSRAEDRRDLVGVGPRRRIETLRKRNQHLAPARIGGAFDDVVAQDRVPVGEEADLCIRGVALDLRRHGKPRLWRSDRSFGPGYRGGRSGRRRRWRGRHFVVAPLALAGPPLIDRRLDDLPVFEHRRPVEFNLRVLRLELPQRIRLERHAADPHAAGGAKHVKNS
jgi:hypothetical protein